MKIKYLFIVLLAAISGSNIYGQQIFRISQYSQHNFLYNPGAAGAASASSVGGAYRKMWASMPGGPQTSIVYFDKYFAGLKTGLSVVAYDDKTGPTSRTGGELNLSYSIEMNNGNRLMFGLAGQVLQYKINKEDMAKYIPGDPLLTSAGNKTSADASAGIYWNGKALHLGVSVKQLVQSKLDLINNTTELEGRLYRHFYFMGDYNLRTDEDNVLIPNFLVKYLPNAPAEIEGGVRLEHKELVWVGVNYHYRQSLSAYAGVKIEKKFAVGYALDIYKTPISVFDDGGLAHEISLRYHFIK